MRGGAPGPGPPQRGRIAPGGGRRVGPPPLRPAGRVLPRGLSVLPGRAAAPGGVRAPRRGGPRRGDRAGGRTGTRDHRGGPAGAGPVAGSGLHAVRIVGAPGCGGAPRGGCRPGVRAAARSRRRRADGGREARLLSGGDSRADRPGSAPERAGRPGPAGPGPDARVSRRGYGRLQGGGGAAEPRIGGPVPRPRHLPRRPPGRHRRRRPGDGRTEPRAADAARPPGRRGRRGVNGARERTPAGAGT